MICFCNYCNKKIIRSPAHISKRNFCCRDCYNKAKKEDKTIHPSYNGGKYVNCHNCGKSTYKNPSTLKNNEKSFCSRKCLGIWNSKNKVGKNALAYKNLSLEKTCLVCSAEFTTYFMEQKCCSLTCGNKSKEKKVTATCTNCSKDYVTIPSNIYWSNKRGSTHNFCSSKCCNEYRQGENHPSWIADRTKLKNRNKSIRGSKQMEDWRTSVFLRDNFTCQLCGTKNGEGTNVVLNAHHIVRFTDNEDKRFNSDNGLTLCTECHKKTYGKEKDYENMFFNIINDIGKV